MAEQPEALRLADWMETFNYPKMEESAAELRRLHAVNAQLLEALEWIANRCPEQMLKQPLHTVHQEAVYDAGACARAAIAAAKGGS
jgi:hypothetical protein